MSSRNDAFRSDPESSSVLKSLGYTDEQISGTPGEGSADALRTSLRQLSAAHSDEVQREHMPSTPANPKFEKQVDTPDSPDYWQGRKDEAFQRKENQNQVPKTRGRAAAKPPPSPGQQILTAAVKMAKSFGGSKGGSASKALGGVSRAQKGRRR